MAYKIQPLFSTGELDPALHELTNIDKYQQGLKTARNVVIGKTGRIISRPGTRYIRECNTSSGTIAAGKKILWGVPGTQYYLEVGVGYIRVYTDYAGGSLIGTVVTSYTESDLYSLQFEKWDKDTIVIFCFGRVYEILTLSTATLFSSTAKLRQIIAPHSIAAGTMTGTGYAVSYACTSTYDNRESAIVGTINDNLPISTAERNDLLGYVRQLDYPVLPNGFTLNFFRRPTFSGILGNQDENGVNGYGFIGTGVYAGTAVIGGVNMWVFACSDVGQEADYVKQPAEYSPEFYNDSTNAGAFNSFARTGTRYQRRLVIAGTNDRAALFSSRLGSVQDFTRTFPILPISSFAFKVGTSGHIVKLMDLNGLVAFTTEGIYSNQLGPLTAENLGMNQKGNYVIDERLAPLKVPGAVLFVEKTTNTIMALKYDDNSVSYSAQEISILSDHLLRGRRIVSWDYLYSDVPVVVAVMDDGEAIVLSYNQEFQISAWTTMDTDGDFISVTCVKNRYYDSALGWDGILGPDKLLFVVKRGTKFFTEEFTPFTGWLDKNAIPERVVNSAVKSIKQYVGSDSAVFLSGRIFDTQSTSNFDITADTPGDWDGTLTITASATAFANTSGNGAVGTVFRFFDSDGTSIDLTVTTYTSTTVVKVTPSTTFPSDEATDVTELYKTYATITGLSHLEGEIVSVLVDGYVEGSPLNAVETYDTYTVSGGSITLTGSRRGAIIIVGLPYVCDVETLDIDTVEQKPTLLQSRQASKMYIKVFNSRGLYAGSELPTDDTNTGMEDIEYRVDDLDDLGNAAQNPYTRRVEVTVPGDWDSNGRICLRQVDPLPFEILSIIPDLEVYRR